MPSIIDRVRSFLPTRSRVQPYTEQGVAGFAVYGGYIRNIETNQQLLGAQRWITATDILSNISIAAASVRYFLNLTSRPAWRCEPPNDSVEAKAAAEFMESVIHGTDASWSRIVRRSGMYRYHGFGFNEWVAKRREDGRIGLASIEPRPQHTIERWDIDNNGGVIGVCQRDPQSGHEIYLPRNKLVYLRDDTLTDNPEGMGWFRHLVDPANRLKKYLQLEGMGYERDLSGIPVGRAPINKINEAVKAGKMTQADATSAIAGLREFVQMKSKEPESGLVLDSQTYRAKTDTGETISSVTEWGLELLTGEQTSLQNLGEAVKRIAFDMALIMGTESLLVGREGQGSRALSEDKSHNLYLNINSTLTDMAESYDRDIVGPIWAMNGLPEELRPTLKTEDASFKDVEMIAKVLADMSAAGAIMSPNDPAIDDVRDLMGISRAPEMTPEEMGALRGTTPSEPEDDEDANAPSGEAKKKHYFFNPIHKAEARSLYVSRRLKNAGAFIEWAKAQGFSTTTPDDDLHVTIAFSRDLVDWSAAGDSFDSIKIDGGARSVEPLGDKGAVVLKFESKELADRWQQFRDNGASWDFPSYQPHVTITYKAPDNLDLSKVEPYSGPLEFGPEIFGEVVEDWEKGITEKKGQRR